MQGVAVRKSETMEEVRIRKFVVKEREYSKSNRHLLGDACRHLFAGIHIFAEITIVSQ